MMMIYTIPNSFHLARPLPKLYVILQTWKQEVFRWHFGEGVQAILMQSVWLNQRRSRHALNDKKHIIDLIQMENIASRTLIEFNYFKSRWNSSVIRYFKRIDYHFTLYFSLNRAFQYSVIYQWNIGKT